MFDKYMRKTTLLLLICITATLTGCMEKKTTSAKDKKTEEKLFDYKQIELDNGMDVITLEDFSAPIVSVQVWYKVGSKDDDPERQGFAHMFEHMMFKGTDRVSDQDHFNAIHKVGGTNNAYTSFDKTVYTQIVPADKLEMVLWLEAERMTHLRIDQNTYDTERQVVEEERRIRENQPYGTVFQKTLRELFKVHPYQWTPIGELDHLRAASIPELREFWNKYYVPSNAALVLVGAVTHEEGQKLAKKYFGWIPKYDEPKRVTVREPEQTEARKLIIDDENAPAGQVNIFWRTVPAGHKDEVVLDLLSNILGAGNSSRLYRELVAEKQLAVSAGAWGFNLEDDGMFGFDATITPETNSEEVIEIYKKHVDEVIANGVTEAELEKAKNRALKSVVTSNLTIESKTQVLGNAAIVKGDTSMANAILDDIKAVTTGDIKQAAAKYLKDERSLTVIIKENKAGAAGGKKGDEGAPVTAEPEINSPKPGRKGVERPAKWAKKVPIGKLKAYKSTPEYTVDKLDNGLKVMVVPNHEVPFVSVQLGLLSGGWTETKPGTASMAMKMLTKGTENYTEAQLAEELEKYAISLRGSANMDTSSVTASCLKEYLDKAMTLMGEVMFKPTFDKTEFAKIQKQVVTQLTINEETPRYIVAKEFRKVLYGDHPYARTTTGEKNDVGSLAANDLKLWWSKASRPDMATLIFAGDITRDKAMELAKNTFGDWKTGLVETGIVLADIPEPKETHIYIVDRPGSMQSEIRIGKLGMTRRNQPDYFTSRVVSEYFGGSFYSRINSKLRVEKGLTYGARGYFSAQNLAGQFMASTFTKTSSTVEAIQVILDLLEDLYDTPPSDDELSNTKSSQAGSFVRNRETPQDVAGDLWLIESQGLSSDYLDKLLASIADTTKQDCVELVKKYIDPNKMAVVITGDAAKIKADLEKIAPLTVITRK